MAFMARRASCLVEAHTGKGAGGTLLRGDIRKDRAALTGRFSGKAQLVYLDPPFNTGKHFSLKQRAGSVGWRTGSPSIALPAYSDRWESEEALLSLLREAAETAHALLSDEGSLFFHIDSRLHAHVRMMLDEIFGARNFVNEIIWVYQTGGRATSHFSRKHDVILYYRKTPRAFFDIRAVSVPRESKNHMRRGVDEHGRAYRAITSLGKEYRYYDDEQTHPSDVWSDIPQMQQKDPQRTGYDTQKPLALLERIVLCASRPGDLVCDLFGGSGTTAVAAARHGRRFLLLDTAETALSVSRRRLLGSPMRIETPTAEGAPSLFARRIPALGIAQVEVTGYAMEDGLCPLPLSGLDALEQLSLGYLRDDTFYALDNAARSRQQPELRALLEAPNPPGALALLTVDVLGRRMVHTLEDIHGE